MNIKELREKRLDVWNKAKAFLDSHREEGVLSAEDDAVYARMEKELDDLAKEITRQEKLESYEREMAKNLTTPLTTKPNNEMPVEGKKGRASDAYKKAMIDAMRCNFKRVSNVLQEGVDADGGYLVPEEYDKRIIDILSEENIMRKLGTTITKAVSTRSTSLRQSLLQRGLKKAVRSSLAMQPSVKSSLMPISSMWRLKSRRNSSTITPSTLKVIS